MKSILLLLLILGNCIYSSAQKYDTAFIKRGFYDEGYYAIYITQNPKDKGYTWLRESQDNFRLDDFYKDQMASLAGDLKNIKKGRVNIYHSWQPLHLYKKMYVLFSPCCTGENNWVYLNDSIFLSHGCEDVIQAVVGSKQSANKLQLSVKRGDGEVKQVIIHTINAEKGLAVFEYPDNEPQYRYQLMVQTRKMKDYPVIVSRCASKFDDYGVRETFDAIDYSRLLKLQ